MKRSMSKKREEIVENEKEEKVKNKEEEENIQNEEKGVKNDKEESIENTNNKPTSLISFIVGEILQTKNKIQS